MDVNLHQEGGYCDLELVCKSNSGTYIHEFEKRVAIHCHIVLSFKPGNTKIRGPYIRDGRKVLGETLLVSNDMSAKCFSCCAFLRRNKSCGSGIQSHDARVSLAVLLYILRRVRGIPPLFVFYIYLFSLYFFSRAKSSFLAFVPQIWRRRTKTAIGSRGWQAMTTATSSAK